MGERNGRDSENVRLGILCFMDIRPASIFRGLTSVLDLERFGDLGYSVLMWIVRDLRSASTICMILSKDRIYEKNESSR